MPGMAPISLQQFINPATGRPYAGARAAFYEASTNTPIAIYSDYSLGTEHPNPVRADAYGRFPVIFIDEAVEFYRLRLTTSGGAVLPLGESGSFDIPVLPVIGPTASEGGGSEAPVDPNAVYQTGDVLWVPKAGTRSGFVRMNGRTIGSASSGASERANADTEDLYSYAWNTYSNAICPVTGGRGISAAADFAANKPITVLDMRNSAPFGLDDMGNSAASGFTGITFDVGDATTAGSSGGVARRAITQAQIPSYNLTTSGLTTASQVMTNVTRTLSDSGASSGANIDALTNVTLDITKSNVGLTGTLASGGSGEAMPIMNPFMLGTFHWKL